ncbi:MAG: MBL fold metallo-hydrolase [Candidatus Latescibacteria bacterium]|nr:MBL fold metallo-hydrolase [Candidatus Latescibacterota bacterium]
MALIKPVLQDRALLDDIAAAQDDDHFFLWWLGQSGFLIQWRGHRLLFDPYLSDSLTHKYASTDKPHVRMTEMALGPGQLEGIALATSTHNHTDHLDAETLLSLRAANPDMSLAVSAANRAFAAERLGGDEWFLNVDAGQQVEVGPFVLHGVPAAHEELDRDRQGRYHYLGYVACFGPWTVYHSGDTLLYEGMEEALAPFAIDVALLPINGRKPERRVAGNLSGSQAAGLAQRIGAGTVVPCHYEMFEFNTASPAAFVEECQRLGQAHAVLCCGQRWSSASL